MPVDVQDVLLLVGGEVVPCGFDDGHDGESCRAFGEFCGVFDSPVAVVAVVHGLCLSFSFLALGGWRLVLFGVCAPRVGLLGGGVAACASARCEGEAGAVCAGSVVALCGEEGKLGFISVDHDEDGVFFPPVPDVVFVARVFDAGVHDAGASVASVERAGDMVPAVCAAAAPFVGFHGEGGVVVEGEGCGECVAVIVHVGEGDVGDVASSQNLCVFFCRAVLVEDDCVVGGVLVHSSYCAICTRACLHVWTRGWVVVPARLGVCLSASARGLGGGCSLIFGECVANPAFRAYVRLVGGLGMWRL